MNSEESLWEAVRTLWMKYCGVADEYKMLRDRWLYLYNENSLPIIPNLRNGNDSTFDLLDNHIEAIDGMFKEKFNLCRDKMEDYDQSSNGLKNSDILDYSRIKEYFFDLSNYVGLLKLCFFQRTVSLEISHVASGIPKSPERTIGNELFYLAADRSVKGYYECLNIPYGKWDGFVTFIPPLPGGFQGALYRPSPHFELFHIAMSEEQKYFVGSYMALSHELGHAAIVGNNYAKRINFGYMRNATINHAKGKWKGSLRLCEDCLYNPDNMIYYKTKDRDPFEEFFADILAFRIGGINTINNLMNEIFYLWDDTNVYEDKKDPKKANIVITLPPAPESIIRFAGLLSYSKGLYPKQMKEIESRFNGLLENCKNVIIEKLYIKSKQNTKALGWNDIELWGLNERDVCINCLKNMGKCWSDYILSKNIYLSEIFISDNGDFNIEKDEEREIIDSIVSGIPCTGSDPRHILHCYYEAYKKSKGEDRPSYPATIQSLAFNKYNKEEK